MKTLYKYCRLSTAYKIISKNRLLLSNPDSFNDPFDCKPIIDRKLNEKSNNLIKHYALISNLLQDKRKFQQDFNLQENIINEILNWINKLKSELKVNPRYYEPNNIKMILDFILSKNSFEKEQIDKYAKEIEEKIIEIVKEHERKALISCFCTNSNSILMWSHYGDSHKGVCIEFEVKNLNEYFLKVDYNNARPVIDYYDYIRYFIGSTLINEEVDFDKFPQKSRFINIFARKSKQWAYENEYRCIFNHNDKVLKENKKTTYLLLDKANIVIKKIYIGSKVDTNNKEFSKLINLAYTKKIKTVFMKLSDSKFEILPEK